MLKKSALVCGKPGCIDLGKDASKFSLLFRDFMVALDRVFASIKVVIAHYQSINLLFVVFSRKAYLRLPSLSETFWICCPGSFSCSICNTPSTHLLLVLLSYLDC